MVLDLAVHCSVTWYGHETKLGQAVRSSRAFRADWSSGIVLARINTEYETGRQLLTQVQGLTSYYVPRALAL